MTFGVGIGTVAVATVVALVLSAWGLVIAHRRGVGGRGLRTVATLALVLAGWSLFVEPRLARKTRAVTEVVLVTAGADAGQVTRGRVASGREAPVAVLPGVGDLGEAAEGAVPVADLGAVARRWPGVSGVRVIGYGRSSASWQRLPGVNLTVVPPPALSRGLRSVRWPRQVVLGREWVVEGALSAEASRAADRVVLVGPGGDEAEAPTDAASGGRFRLVTKPRIAGRLGFRLELRQGDDVVASRGVHTVVEPPRAPRVLWLEGAPSFETRSFKAWLATRGGTLAVRSRLSRNRDRREFLNRDAIDLRRVDGDLLGAFDIVVIDRRSLLALSAGERAALSAAVREDGLGLVVRYGATVPPTLPGRATDLAWAALPAETLPALDELSVRVRWPAGDAAPPLVVAPRVLVAGVGVEPLAADDAGRVLVARRPHARGWVASSLLNDTFRWQLEGHPDQHARFWSDVLDAVARPVPGGRWYLPSTPMVVDQPVTVVLETDGTSPRAQLTGPDGEAWPLALARDRRRPARYTASFWPRHSGWHRLSVEGDGPTAALDIAGADAWPVWQQAERVRATQLRAARPALGGGSAPVVPAPVPIARGWLYALLLVAAAVLWGDERWRGGRSGPA